MPASTVKLFTTGFARSVLGGTARRPTRVVGAGSLDPATGEWVGSWALEMNGDPSLERAEGSGPTLYDLAMQLASAGVRKLTGPLQLQSSNGPANALYPDRLVHRGTRAGIFAPLVGPLTLHENIVWITVRPGARVGTARPADRDGARRDRLDGERHGQDPIGPALATRAPPARRRRLGRDRHDRRAGGPTPAHGGRPRPARRAQRRVGRRAQARRHRVEPVAVHRRRSRGWTADAGRGFLPAAGLPGERDQPPKPQPGRRAAAAMGRRPRPRAGAPDGPRAPGRGLERRRLPGRRQRAVLRRPGHPTGVRLLPGQVSDHAGRPELPDAAAGQRHAAPCIA